MVKIYTINYSHIKGGEYKCSKTQKCEINNICKIKETNNICIDKEDNCFCYPIEDIFT